MKILIVHADMASFGGAEVYSKAIVVALKKMGHKVDIADISGVRYSDGSIRPLPFSFIKAVPGLRSLSLLKYSLVCKEIKKIAANYNLVFSTYGELPKLSINSICLLHAPVLFSGDRSCLEILGVVDRGWVYVVWRKFYSMICRLIAKPAIDKTDGVVRIANSKWTSDFLKDKYGVKADYIVYPKVAPIDCNNKNYLPTNLNFICVGRIVPNKRLEEAIYVISALRKEGFSAKLTIVGRGGSSYAHNLVNELQDNEYVRIVQDASKDVLRIELERAQYGLHMYRNEHFGIAVAEMCMAGCVPFVYNGGGVKEIVTEEILRFNSINDLTTKIKSVVAAPPEIREKLSKKLRESPAVMGAINFDSVIENLLNKILTYDR